MSLDRLLPHSLDAERAVLGSMIRDNRTIAEMVVIVKPGDFYTDAHQKIFSAIAALHDKAQPVDLVVLLEALKERKQVDDIGGYPYLGVLWDAAPTAANAEYYANIVREKSLVRSLILVAGEIQRDAYEQSAPAASLLESAEQKILAIGEGNTVSPIYTSQQLVHEFYDAVDKWQNSALGGGLPTGFPDLDELTGGFRDSELTILAARTGHGKTAFALQIARNVLLQSNAPTFFVSLEQKRLELAKRVLCSMAGVDGHKVKRGKLTNEELQRLIQAGSELLATPLLVDDESSQTMQRIAANARRLKHRHGVKLVIVDYLGLAQSGTNQRNRQEEVGSMSRRLKCLARELNLSVLCLCQLNRGPEERKDHRPHLHDLRESGAMEMDADVVMLLHRPDAYDPNDRPGQLDVIVDKQRDGPTGEVHLMFDRKFFRFENFDPTAAASDPPYVGNGSIP